MNPSQPNQPATDRHLPLASIDDLRGVYGPPNPAVLDKVLARFDKHATAFVEAARFAAVNVRGPDGAPVSVMAGGPGGFARVLDPVTVAIDVPRACWPADRLGCPTTEDFAMGTLFVIPGVKETLRLKGVARVAPEPGRGEGIVRVTLRLEALYFHCAKAFMRSRVWERT